MKMQSGTMFLEREPRAGSWISALAAGPEVIEAEVTAIHPLVGGKILAARRIAVFVDPEVTNGAVYWLAICPSLENIATQGESREEALLNAEGMVNVFLDYALEKGHMVPASDIAEEVAIAA